MLAAKKAMRMATAMLSFLSLSLLSGAEWELYYSSTGTIGIKPNVMFMLDASTSMLDTDVALPVCYDPATFLSSTTCDNNPSREEYMEYAVNGPDGLFDAILENPARAVNLAVGQFPGGSLSSGGTGGRPRILQGLTPFSSGTVQNYKEKVRDEYINGGSMSTNPGEAMVYYWDHLFTQQELLDYCKPNVLVVITDGASSADYAQTLVENSAFVQGEFRTRAYAQNMFQYINSRTINGGESDPDAVARYLLEDHISRDTDLCVINCDETNCPGGNCLGNKIFTYGLSYKNNETKFQLVQDYAAAGGGEAFDVADKEQIVDAVNTVFDRVFSFIPASQTAPAITVDGSYAGNEVLMTAFRPTTRGHWFGNLRKYCVFNDRPAGTDVCLYEPLEGTQAYGVREPAPNSTPGTVTELLSAVAYGTLTDEQKDGYGRPLVPEMGTDLRLRTAVTERDIYYLGTFGTTALPDYACTVEPPSAGVPVTKTKSSAGAVEVHDRTFAHLCPDPAYPSDPPCRGTSSVVVNAADVNGTTGVASSVHLSAKLTIDTKSAAKTADAVKVELSFTPASGTAWSVTLYNQVPTNSNPILIESDMPISPAASPLGTWSLIVTNRQDTWHIWINKVGDPVWSLTFAMETPGVAAVCGNGVKEPGECCDGDTLACSAVDAALTGTAACRSACDNYDLSTCSFTVPETTVFTRLQSSAATSEKDKKVYNFMQGFPYELAAATADGLCTAAACQKRDNVAGDSMFSAPVIIGDTAVIGTNAGYLEVYRQINGTGQEIKAIVPTAEILQRHINGLFAVSPNKAELFGVDVTPYRIESAGRDLLFVGFGRGGKGFVALDTASVVTAGSVPLLKGSGADRHNWLYTKPQLVDWGFADTDGAWVGEDRLVVSSGYHGAFDDDAAAPVASNAAVDLHTGLWWYQVAADGSITFSAAEITASTFPVAAAPAFVRSGTTEKEFNTFLYHNQKGPAADIMYYADLQGDLHVYRNVDGDPDHAVGERIFSLTQPLSATNATDLNVFGRPAVTVRRKNSDQEIWVGAGTGDHTRPTTAVGVNNLAERNVIFSLRHCVGLSCVTGVEQHLDDLYDAGAKDHTAPDATDIAALKAYRAQDVSSLCADPISDPGCPSATPGGWFFRLPANRSVVGDILSYNNRFYITVFEFDPSVDISADSCSTRVPPGNSYLYEVSAHSGLPVFDYGDDDRIIKDLGAGRASQPVLAVSSDGDAKIYVTKGNGELVVIDTEDYNYYTKKYRVLWWKVR